MLPAEPGSLEGLVVELSPTATGVEGKIVGSMEFPPVDVVDVALLAVFLVPLEDLEGGVMLGPS